MSCPFSGASRKAWRHQPRSAVIRFLLRRRRTHRWGREAHGTQVASSGDRVSRPGGPFRIASKRGVVFNGVLEAAR